MRRRIGRKERKKQKKILIIGSLSLLLFLCVGYAAFSTNLSIIARGNIKQKKAGPMLKELCDTEIGDGLYKDIYEDDKCIYKGTNPNNYITFNDETWRIISIDANNTIKIMRSESIGNMSWDISGGTNGSNDWARPADINTYLNSEYFKTLSNQNIVVTHSWSIGALEMENTDLSAQISAEKSRIWNGKIGLITVSEYLNANTNVENCGNYHLNNLNRTSCLTTNWIYDTVPTNGYLFTISPLINDIDTVFHINGTSSYAGNIGNYNANNSRGIVPVLYLSSDIILLGKGTEDNPYIITN